MNNSILKGIRNPSLAIDYFTKDIDQRLSRFFLGNSAGISNNFKGYLAYTKSKKISNVSDNFAYDELASKFKQEGDLQLGQFYDSSLISNISKKFNELIEDDKFSFVRAKRNDRIFSRALFRGFEQIPESLQLLNKDISTIIEAYYGSYFKIAKFAFWRNYHVPSEFLSTADVINNRWHCDPYNTSWIKLFIYLTDVTKEDGPFCVQSTKRTKELMRLGYKNRRNYNLSSNVIEDENHIWQATGDIGTTFMCNCNLGLHKAGVPEPNHYRDVIQIQLAPSSEKLPVNWPEHFVDKEEPKHSKSSDNSNIRPAD